jgi:small multidrug resistance family-3 protein
MPSPFIALLLFLAAVLEAAGDALIRKGLNAGTYSRLGYYVSGSLLLFTYGYFVNISPWNFGRLLGVYIAFFFLVAQVIGWMFFGQAPSAGTLLGGALIVAGGIVVYARG